MSGNVYVMSDIHGNSRRFESVMKKINLQQEDTLYVLGDVIDRYPDGIKILRKLMEMPNVKMLLGNHEHMMLCVLDKEYYKKIYGNKKPIFIHDDFLWYANGGYCTHTYLKHIRKEIRAEIFEYLRNLPLNYDINVNGQKFKLIHGGCVEHYEKYKNSYSNITEYAVWHRIDDETMFFSEDCVLVFGHTPTNDYSYKNPLCIFESNNVFGIDCGSGFSLSESKRHSYPDLGRLACLRLNDLKEFYSDEYYVLEGKEV